MASILSNRRYEAACVGCVVDPLAECNAVMLAVNDTKLKHGAMIFPGALQPCTLANNEVFIGLHVICRETAAQPDGRFRFNQL